jgi:hypothetical protein
MSRGKLSLLLTLATIISIMAMILPAFPAAAADPYIDLSDSEGPVGESITIKGYSFPSGTNYYTIDFENYGSNPIVKRFSAGTSFTKTITIPERPAGDYAITVFDDDDNEITSETFTIIPTLTLSPTTAKVGDTITAKGTGYSTSSLVTLDIDGDEITDKKTNSSGTFSVTFTVPDASRGAHTITGTDEDDNDADADLAITPKIIVSATSASIGDKITVSGSGFTASSAITITLDGINTNTTATTNAEGTLSEKQVTIPVIAGGNHTLTVKDAAGYSATASLSTTQSISINPKSGPADTEITITGGGFTPSKPVTVTFKGTTVTTTPATVTSDTSGNFTATIKAPKYAAGVYTISVTQGSLTSNASFTQTSTAGLSATSGAVGSTITASGSGYASGAKITLKYDGNDLTSATADNNGSFSATFKVPAGPAGQHKIIITDNINPATLNFTATAASLLSAGTGNVGSNVDVGGDAYAPGSTITIKFDANVIVTATADASGSYMATLTIPASKGGNHTITVTDGTTTTTTSFSVETTPPGAPALTLPLNGEKNDAEANFQWNAVTDPSAPVTYTLQIAQDSAFASIVLEKTGLTSNSFQLSEQQKLKSSEKDKPYYWRVKAIDAASNESNWSTAQTFTVGIALPSWLWIAVGILGGVLLLVIGLLVGRKMKGGFGINRSK